MKKKLSSFFWLALGFLLAPSVSFAQLSVSLPGVNANVSGGGWNLGIGNSGLVGTFMPVNPGLPGASIIAIVGNLLMWLLSLFAILGILGFVLSGVFYLTSAGDDDQIKKAKKIMMNSIIGILVGLAGFVIMQAIFRMLNGTAAF
jgi:hypothetical protein